MPSCGSRARGRFGLESSPSTEISETFRELVEFGVLASAPDPFDPMEKAFHDLGRGRLAGAEHLHGAGWKLVQTYGLRPDLLAMSQVWQPAGGTEALSSPPKARPKPSPTCAVSTLLMWSR